LVVYVSGGYLWCISVVFFPLFQLLEEARGGIQQPAEASSPQKTMMWGLYEGVRGSQQPAEASSPQKTMTSWYQYEGVRKPSCQFYLNIFHSKRK
jgi:hypothetical protein